jgi:ABC-2 type transport system permease protein
MEVLLTSVSSRQMIAGKLAALGLLGLLQTAMWMGVMWAVASFGGRPLNVPAGFELPRALIAWTFVYGLLGYAMYGAQMAGLGALAPELKDTKGASFLIMLPMIVSYTFLVVILEAPDGLIAVTLSLFPLSSPVAMITRMIVTQVPAWQPPAAAALQAVAVVIIVRAVARMFRAQVMLSGQPFSVRRYLRAFLGRA